MNGFRMKRHADNVDEHEGQATTAQEPKRSGLQFNTLVEVRARSLSGSQRRKDVAIIIHE